MKKLLPLIVSLTIMVFCVSCEKNNPEPDPFIDINAVALDFPAEPQAPLTVNILANGEWTLASSATWINIPQKSGAGNTSVSITAAINTSAEVREATITATRKHLTKTLTVRQLGQSPAILINQTEGYLAAYGDGVLNFNITTNVELETTIDADWLKEINPVKLSKSVIDVVKKFSASKHSGPNPRTANVTFKQIGGQLSQSIVVTQLPSSPVEVIDLYLSNESCRNTTVVNSEGAAININPANETTFKFSNPEWMKSIPTESPAAASLVTKAAPSASTIVLLQNANEQARHGEIILLGRNGINDTVFVTQIGVAPQIATSFSSVNLPANGGSTTLSIISNGDSVMSVTNNAKWLKVDGVKSQKLGGSYKFSYKLTVVKNDSLQKNVTNLEFKGQSSKLNSVVKVQQNSFGQKSMYLKEKTMTISAASALIVIEPVIQSGSKEFIATISKSWITQDPSRKELFTVEANTTSYDRTSTIIFSQRNSSARDTLHLKQLKAKTDAFSRHTDSLAIRELVSMFGAHFPWFKWPAQATLKDLHNIGIRTSLVDNQWRVTSIQLPSSKTYSPTLAIPAQLWNLSQLQSLEGYGPYSGQIPAQVANLVNLKKLIFVNSSISGDLPKEICSLPLLDELVIENLDFKKSTTPDKTAFITSLPVELSTMKSLKKLTLTLDTQTFPAILCDIQPLESLIIMQKGKLENHTIPAAITNLHNLSTFKYYSLNYTRTGCNISSDLFTLPNLKTLHICTNEPLTSSVSAATNLTNLTVSGLFIQLTNTGVRLPHSITNLDIDSYLMTAITDEIVTNNLESLAVTAINIQHMSDRLKLAPQLHTLIWRGDDIEKCKTNFAIFGLTNIKKLFYINATGLFTDAVLSMTNLTHLQILNSDVEGYLSDKIWRFFVSTLGKPLANNDPTKRLVIINNRFQGDVGTQVSQAPCWIGSGEPASGAWSPNNNIIPQQNGYKIRVN